MLILDQHVLILSLQLTVKETTNFEQLSAFTTYCEHARMQGIVCFIENSVQKMQT